ncbi:hypothetical protein [Demequina globuliformis]|uniref:hypothetical protein n=1 Tax=Demequina globuliformis TaxID=676202 RepID=UPI000782AA04|nr:hypothetical protein [Demequina globuliformis]
MKKAAIDCYMAEDGFNPHWNDNQKYAKWGWAYHHYARPDANGEGGGSPLTATTTLEAQGSVAPRFDEIRSTIDTILTGWDTLPSGALCRAPQSSANAATALLGGAASVATVNDSDEIVRATETAMASLNDLAGSFVGPVYDKYCAQLLTVTQNLGTVYTILEAQYAAQQAMWPAAREDVVAICTSAAAAWEGRAAEIAAGARQDSFTVVAAVAGAVATVATAGVGTAATVGAVGAFASTTVSTLSSLDASGGHVSGDTYAEILASLVGALGALNETIAAQELELNRWLDETLNAMSTQLADYNLDAFTLADFSAGDGSSSINRTDTDMITTAMGRVEGALSEALRAAGAPPVSNPTPRPHAIGVGLAGTHLAASGVYDYANQCLQSTAAEYTRGRGLFDAAVADYFNTDAESQLKVTTLLSQEALIAEMGGRG